MCFEVEICAATHPCGQKKCGKGHTHQNTIIKPLDMSGFVFDNNLMRPFQGAFLYPFERNFPMKLYFKIRTVLLIGGCPGSLGAVLYL